MNGVFLKVCGITRLEDARHALAEGATAIGFVFWPKSPRAISPDQAAEIIAVLPDDVATVGVFVNERVETIHQVIEKSGIRAVQLHGDETVQEARALGRPFLKSVTLDSVEEVVQTWPGDTPFVLDAVDPLRRGGTGETVDWKRAAEIARRRRIVLAGGLTPRNVDEAVRTVRPFGVDVSSGVETTPGVKDFDKVSRFLANARRAFAGL